MSTIDFVTDTATLCVFDLQALRHRLHDDADWWTVPDEELKEVNDGNVAFIGLGEDGRYKLDVVETLDNGDGQLYLHCPSGRIFLGAGEEVTSDGLEPEALRGGTFLALVPGTYQLTFRRVADRTIALGLRPYIGAANNRIDTPIKI